MSWGLLASRIIKRAPRARAASCTVALSVAAWATLAGLTSTAIVEAGNVRLYISSKHFLNNSTFKLGRRLSSQRTWCAVYSDDRYLNTNQILRQRRQSIIVTSDHRYSTPRLRPSANP